MVGSQNVAKRPNPVPQVSALNSSSLSSSTSRRYFHHLLVRLGSHRHRSRSWNSHPASRLAARDCFSQAGRPSWLDDGGALCDGEHLGHHADQLGGHVRRTCGEIFQGDGAAAGPAVLDIGKPCEPVGDRLGLLADGVLKGAIGRLPRYEDFAAQRTGAV